MADERDNSVHVREQGFLKLKITTVMIFAGIIFLATLFSGWLTQTKDIGMVQAEQKILTSTVILNSNRITTIEECVKNLRDDTKEMKDDLKEIRRDQKEFYMKAGKSMGIK